MPHTTCTYSSGVSCKHYAMWPAAYSFQTETKIVAYLTEEKGEGVFAADVWPKMELEEVLPKSDCPAEPPKMLPPRVEVPKPPLP